MEAGLTKNQIISELSRSPHGKLQEYVGVGKIAATTEPEFFSHMIAWDRIKGAIRDAKVALPIVALSVPMDSELSDNALAHLALLGPREFLRAYRFALEVRPGGKMRQIRKIAECYLREKENDRRGFDRTALQHRKVLKELYALAHVKPSKHADEILFKGIYADASVFAEVARLKDMSPAEAAGTIMERKIPFLIAMGALGKKAQEPDLVLALIERMTPTELITNTKMLEKLGIKTNPALRGAYDAAMKKASTSKANVLKTTKAVDAVEDEGLRDKLRGLQEKQFQSQGIEGNWLVLVDRSPSMQLAVEIGKYVGGTLSKLVKGNVSLVFFDSSPMTIDITGLALDQVQAATRHITANGSGTSIGCGLNRMLESNVEVDGITIVSDAAENMAPFFADVYKRYSAKFDKQVPVYLWRCKNAMPAYADRDLAATMLQQGFDLQEFDMRGGVDYYSIPNMVQTMRTNRYSLIDEVMATPLLSLDKVFKHFDRKEVIHATAV